MIQKDLRQLWKNKKKKARSAGKFTIDTDAGEWVELTKGEDSEFIGYDDTSSKSEIRRYQQVNGKYLIILDKTPFYAEQGGQVGDTGFISGKDFELRVVDTVKDGESHIHVTEMVEGEEVNSAKVTVEVEQIRREAIGKNHTATHLMHKALKMVLGDHVQQAGSLVGPEHLRFDLTHYEKITNEQIEQIEEIVNNRIMKNTPLDITIKGFDEARKEGG